MPAQLIAEAVDLVAALQRYRQQRPAGSDGALATFIGSMRDFNAGSTVASMHLEHYPAMTQHYLDKLCAQALAQWELNDILVIHRYGELAPGDDIVLVACWSAHRAAAFDACRAVMEQLKREAPFWKKETTSEGERWVHEAPDSSPR